MGGKSRSSQKTSNSQHTNNYVNDGEFAGAGSVSIDESDHSVRNDTRIDNDYDYSRETNIDEDYDYSTETDISDSNNTDNSTETDINDSYNTDISNDNRIDEDYDYSTETDISDSNNTDNSTSLEDSYNTDNSAALEDSYNTDNSATLEDSYNTDNSIDVGDGNFAGGNITLSDSGAIQAANDIAQRALEESTKQSELVNALSMSALEANANVSRYSIESGERTAARGFSFASDSIDEVQDIATSAIASVGDTSESIINELVSSSEAFASNLSATTQANFATNQEVLAAMSDKSSEDTATIAALAKSTALDGQDIVAQSSEKMTMYMAVAVGVGFLAIAFVVSQRSK